MPRGLPTEFWSSCHEASFILSPQDLTCFVDEATSDVIVRYHQTDIVRVTPNGDITLTTGGYHTVSLVLHLLGRVNTLAAMQEAWHWQPGILWSNGAGGGSARGVCLAGHNVLHGCAL
jgi:hypothetical protein